MEEPDDSVYIVPSLDAYPRVRFFYRNLKSLIPRFKRVAGTLPKCFHNASLNKELDDTLELMRSGVRVTVLGNEDIYRDMFVISSSGQETGNVDIIPKIDVCYVKTNGVAPSNVREVCSLVDKYIKRRTDMNLNLLCLSCENDALTSNRDLDNFKTAVLDELHDHKIELLRSNITVSSLVMKIKNAEQISNFLEAFVIQGFVKINNHLDRFVLEKIPITHAQSSIDQILNILQTGILTRHTLDDLGSIHSDTNVKKENQLTMDKNQNIVLAVPRVVKCLLVPTLAEKFSMSQDDCNTLLCDTNFVNDLTHLLQQELHVRSSLHNGEEYMIDGEWIIKQLNKALPELISDLESDFQRTKRVISVMRRMKYEVHGYLKQTKVPSDCKPRPVAPILPDELREAIQSVKGVFGLGTFYGQIEIHLDEPLAVNDYDQTPEHDIKQLMNKYRFSHPYLIKHVTQKPKAISFDPGNKLHVRSPTKDKNGGTLGGYITDVNKKVYALTCAHVVGTGGDSKVFVCTNEDITPLSKVQDCFSCGSCNDFLFVDIAAAHVLDSMQGNCMGYLMDPKPKSPVQQVSVTMQIPGELVGEKVLKIGAYSGKTYGIIGAVDYGLFGLKAREYLISIYPMPGGIEDNSATDNNASGLSQLDILVRSRVYQTSSVESETGAQLNDLLAKGSPDLTCIDNCENRLCDITNNPSKTTKVKVNQPGCENISYEQINETQPSEMHVTNSGTSEFKVFVRKANMFADEDIECGIFARRGDSGSIVCTNELSGNEEKCSAISMVYAGEYVTRHHGNVTTENDDEDKDICLAFNLHVGLEKLQECASKNGPIRFTQ